MFFKKLFKFKMFILLITISSFILGYFLADFAYNNLFSNYMIETNLTDEYYVSNEYYNYLSDYNSIVSIQNKLVTDNKLSDAKIKNISVSTVMSLKDVHNNLSIQKTDSGMKILVKEKSYGYTIVSKTKLNDGLTKFNKTMTAIYDKNRTEDVMTKNITDLNTFFETYKDQYTVEYNNYLSYYNNIKGKKLGMVDVTLGTPTLINHQNPYIIGAIFMASSFVITIFVIFLLYKKGKLEDIKDISNNETIYRTPFHKSYWVQTVKPFKKLSSLTLIALLFALMLVAKALRLPSGFGELGIGFTYIFFSIIGMLFGPVVGVVIGFFSDILGFFLFPTGYPFFFPYTLSAMLTGFIYGIFFYKTKVTFAKCFYARFLVGMFINVFLGSIWWAIINSFSFEAYLDYTFLIELPKNLIYLLPQSILLFIVFKPVTIIAYNFNLIDEEVSKNVTII